VYFEIPERDLLRLEAVGHRDATADTIMQAPLSVGLETEVGHPHEGVADFRDNQVDSETGTVLVRATLQNPDRKLVPGLFARIRMAMGQPQLRLMVPETSMAADQRGRYVLVVKSDDIVEQRPVQIERNLGQQGFLVIRQGLAREDRVIVIGIQQARPGSKVAPQLVEPDDDLSVADVEFAGPRERH
jgi:RND family efflux transporter MFP subunit